LKQRNLIQALFLFVASGIMAMVVIGGQKAIHNACPYALICFGALKGNLLSLSLGIASLGILLGILFMLISMFWGRIFCGYICPLGTIQDAVFALRGKKARKQIPLMYERKLILGKYWVLGITFILVVSGLAWISINLCPIYSFSRMPSLGLGLVISILLIPIAGFFVNRLWCRYICPYAALLNLAQKLGELLGISRKKIHRNLERCIDCGICNRDCPMNLDILENEYVQSPDCIHCLRCTQNCPKPGTITKKRNP